MEGLVRRFQCSIKKHLNHLTDISNNVKVFEPGLSYLSGLVGLNVTSVFEFASIIKNFIEFNIPFTSVPWALVFMMLIMNRVISDCG